MVKPLHQLHFEKRFLIALLVICSLVATVSAHSGRTDSSGGHKDNKNKSGLGSYHYHYGGYSAHLHTNGYCPYTDTFPSSVKISAEKTDLGTMIILVIVHSSMKQCAVPMITILIRRRSMHILHRSLLAIADKSNLSAMAIW